MLLRNVMTETTGQAISFLMHSLIHSFVSSFICSFIYSPTKTCSHCVLGIVLRTIGADGNKAEKLPARMGLTFQHVGAGRDGEKGKDWEKAGGEEQEKKPVSGPGGIHCTFSGTSDC